MNKQEIFSFAKKNIVSLVCGGVAVAAVVATFYPIGGWYDDLTTASADHAKNFDTVKAFNKTRHLPILDPSQDPSTTGVLPIFPNPPTIKAGTALSTAFNDQASHLSKYMQDLNRQGHDPLVAGSLEKNASTPTLLSFGPLYMRVLSWDPAATLTGDAKAVPALDPDPMLVKFKAQNLQNDILNGGRPPTEDEVKDAKDKLYRAVYEPQIYKMNGVPVNEVEIKAKFAADSANTKERMWAAVAKTKKIYVDKTAFELNPNIKADFPPDLQDLWYAQSWLWIQTDVARAIADANSQSTSVLESPVKRLLALTITPTPMYEFPPTPAAQGQPTGQAGSMPSTATETSALPVAYTVSPTGRASNGMYDVVKFHLLIDVDAEKLNSVLETFSRNRLITVLNENIYALDSTHEASGGYLYGNARMVRVLLDGEILYLRSWTQPLMPLPIQMKLGLIAGSPGAPGAPGGGFNGGFPANGGGYPTPPSAGGYPNPDGSRPPMMMQPQRQ